MIAITKLPLMRWCIALATMAAPIKGTIIIDLSQDLSEDAAAMDSSPGAAAVTDVASSDPFIRSAVVLEKGKVVAKYLREDVDETTPALTHSVTKSWMSLLVGIMVDENLLSVNETLGDIFDDDDAWADVSNENLAYRKAVTVEEMLTMTSGLVDPPGSMEALSDPNNPWGGASLSNSLAFPDIGTKGDFSYLAVGNIFSYVIEERTGMSPREYLAEKVMTHLGILESEYDWEQNLEGVEYAFHGLALAPYQMAKFGQLYLQGGKTGPADGRRQVVRQSWVKSSMTTHAVPANQGEYGYLFWKIAPNMFCAAGLAGQDICIDQNSERVVVQQRDINFLNMDEGNFIVTTVAVDPSLSFDAVMGEDTKDYIEKPSADPLDASSNNTSADLSSDTNGGPIVSLGGFAYWLFGLPVFSLMM